MSTQFPVHPDDAAQLLKIRRYLIGFRITNGWTQHELSEMISGTKGMVYNLESDMAWQWRLSRLQQWPVPFGLRLSAVLEFPDSPDLVQSVHSHPEVAPLYALSKGPGAWQMWQRMYLTSAIRVARRELGISAEEFGLRMGVGRKAITNWENAANELMLPKVLQSARGLDGRVELELDEQA